MTKEEVFKYAVEIFGFGKALDWLDSTPRVFGGKTPAEVMNTPEGLEHVHTILTRIDYGVYS